MDIYARAGKGQDKIETMSHLQLRDPIELNILIKSLGKADMADRATALLQKALDESHSKTGSKDAAEKAVEILYEMENRSRVGDNTVKPDAITYTLVLRVCLQAGDMEKAEEVMGRMEKSNATPPTTQTYAAILDHYAKVGTKEAAERTEKILSHMQQLAKTKDPSLKPDVFSYTICMKAWAKSRGCNNACERMWGLDERMKEDNVQPSAPTSSTLITCLTKSKERVAMERADSLLQTMEQSNRSDLEPDFRHFLPVLEGWLRYGNVIKAARVPKRQIDKYQETRKAEAAPNAATIDMVVQGFIRTGELDKATMLVQKMQDLKDTNLLPEGPDHRMYSSLLNAWKRSSRPDKSTNIEQLQARIAAGKEGEPRRHSL